MPSEEIKSRNHNQGLLRSWDSVDDEQVHKYVKGRVLTKKSWEGMDAEYKNLVFVKRVLLFGNHGTKSYPKVSHTS